MCCFELEVIWQSLWNILANRIDIGGVLSYDSLDFPIIIMICRLNMHFYELFDFFKAIVTVCRGYFEQKR